MPVVNRVASMVDEITGWRRDLHQNPELLYDLPRTSATVAAHLKSFGIDEVVTGLGRTGVVGVIRGRGQNARKVIGLRADMDALPIVEETGASYASKTPGKMHACGHDGHTAMLLGAEKYLSETRNFDGTAVVIFQPAEEGGAGAKAMIDDGLMERFGIDEVYGMHNYPGMPVGQFGIRPGPLLAAADRLQIDIEGLGGHAAKPDRCIDTLMVGCQIVNAIQSIVARNVDPLESGVVSITQFNAGHADNVIPQSVRLRGTARSLTADVRDLLESRLHTVVEMTAAAYGAKATLSYRRDYPVTRNHARETGFAADIASEIVGAAAVDTAIAPVMGGEDFAFMLEQRPGAFIFMGNGDSAGLHHPKYDFDDSAIAFGTSFWVRLAERAMPV
jgi:hippurate hydrolase